MYLNQPTLTKSSYVKDIQLKSHYLFDLNIQHSITEIMLFGTDKNKSQLPSIVKKTYSYRIALIALLSIIFIAIGIILYFFAKSSLLVYAVLTSLVIFLLLAHEIYGYIHFMKSVKNTDTYIKRNKNAVARFRIIEQRDRAIIPLNPNAPQGLHEDHSAYTNPKWYHIPQMIDPSYLN
ncbi:hypothetical protein K502DRAFT_346161 [Neoconidiobolus thromboides FSU 785]|nr:hypothetical protein K502DRAFT_346161 [Neoconidiobolus thromboides FSU 785]